MTDTGETTVPSASRGRGRGKRGGFGKYLRARGRRGGGRPAEFHKRLLLEGEEEAEVDTEEAEEIARKYARRPIVSNIYREPNPEEPVLNEDDACSMSIDFRYGRLISRIVCEVEEDPEVDLSSFLERQRLEDSLDAQASL